MEFAKIKTDTTVTTTVTVNGVDIDEVLIAAANLAHSVLEELSAYRQDNDLEPLAFSCEGEACEFLDLIGD